VGSECEESEGHHDPIGIASPAPPLTFRTSPICVNQPCQCGDRGPESKRRGSTWCRIWRTAVGSQANEHYWWFVSFPGGGRRSLRPRHFDGNQAAAFLQQVERRWRADRGRDRCGGRQLTP